MTQTVSRAIPTAQEHDTQHDPAACCWLCAEGPTWWAELREKRGLSEPPFMMQRWRRLFGRNLREKEPSF